MELRFRKTLIFLAATLTALVLTGACGSSEPEDLTFDIVISDDAWNIEGQIIEVKQGDHVTFNIESDVRGGFHLHGYDLFSEVAPGQPSSYDFTADATGNFEIMLHKFTLASDREGGMEHDSGGQGDEAHGGDEAGEAGHRGGESGTEETEVRLGWFQVFPR